MVHVKRLPSQISTEPCPNWRLHGPIIFAYMDQLRGNIEATNGSLPFSNSCSLVVAWVFRIIIPCRSSIPSSVLSLSHQTESLSYSKHSTMPNYEIEHVIALSSNQQDRLAEAITLIHSDSFTTLSLMVNVEFKDVSNRVLYVGGRRVCKPFTFQHP